MKKTWKAMKNHANPFWKNENHGNNMKNMKKETWILKNNLKKLNLKKKKT